MRGPYISIQCSKELGWEELGMWILWRQITHIYQGNKIPSGVKKVKTKTIATNFQFHCRNLEVDCHGI